jgi:hypothetical protein
MNHIKELIYDINSYTISSDKGFFLSYISKKYEKYKGLINLFEKISKKHIRIIVSRITELRKENKTDNEIIDHFPEKYIGLTQYILKETYNELDLQLIFLDDYDIDIELEKKQKKSEKEDRFYQKKLRKDCMNKYNNKCTISGNNEDILLEVAHIIPVSECKINKQKVDVNNTLLLWVDIHRFFDKYLISINPKTSKVETNNKYLKTYDQLYVNLNDETKNYLEYHYDKYINN